MLNTLKSILAYIEKICDGVIYIVNSILDLVKWVGSALSFAVSDVLYFIPAMFVGLVGVIVTIYLIKIFAGGSNK